MTKVKYFDKLHSPDTLHPPCRNYLTPSDFF